VAAQDSKEIVLVLTNPCDVVADRVVQRLRDKGCPVARFDPADMPLRCTMTMGVGGAGSRTKPAYLFRNYGPGIGLDYVRSIWYRRPGTFVLPTYASSHTGRFAATELSMALGGMLRSLDCFWMNRPGAIVEADYKVDQLVRAARMGLLVPDTCITSQSAHAKHFVEEHERKVVIKVLGDPDIYAPDDGPDIVGNIFTSRLRPDEPVPFDRVRDAPVLLQKEVPKQADIRVTVVGDVVYAVSIDSQSTKESTVDWRIGGPGLPHCVIELPELLRTQLVRLVRSYDLSFAAIDMVLSTTGEYVFLELNPSGEWGWLERVTELDISETVAAVLMNGGPADPSSEASAKTASDNTGKEDEETAGTEPAR
jgi:hypothetical protein